MGFAFALITIGGIMAYSGFTGHSIADVMSGLVTGHLNPSGGGNVTYTDPANNPNKPQTPGQENQNPSGLNTTNKWGFKGPHAAQLAAAAHMAEDGFGLDITSVAGGVHAPDSLHYVHAAFDSSGKANDMSLFAHWLVANYPDASEIFYYADGIAIKNGKALGHRIDNCNCVHFGWA